MTFEERKALLMKPTFNYKDIMLYCNCKRSKAHEIMQTCKNDLNGTIFWNKHVVSRNSVLAYMGTTIDQEREIIRKLENEQLPQP